MTVLSGPSVDVLSGAAPIKPSIATKAHMSFHRSRIFKGLGRIDEDKSFRASLSNRSITSQNSSPRPLDDTNDSEVNDWLASLSPETHNTNQNKNDRPELSRETKTVNNNTSIRKTDLVSTVTHARDPKIDDEAPAEHRQDQALCVAPKPQSNLLSQNDSISSSCSPSHAKLRGQQQHPQHDLDDEEIKRENEALRKECDELSEMILQMKTESNLLRIQSAAQLQNYQIQIEKAFEEKQRLQNNCNKMEDQIWNLRTITRLKEENKWRTENRLWKQRKQPQVYGNEAAISDT